MSHCTEFILSLSNINSWDQGENFYSYVYSECLSVFGRYKTDWTKVLKNCSNTFHGFVFALSLHKTLVHYCVPLLCETSLIPSGTAICAISGALYMQCITDICNKIFFCEIIQGKDVFTSSLQGLVYCLAHN